MAVEHDELLIHRQSFERFMYQQSQKKNTILFTADDVVKVIDFLSGKEVKISNSLRRRIQRNSFILKSFAGDPGVLCVLKDGNYLRVVPDSRVFDVIHKEHADSLIHSGVLSTYNKIKDKYAQISRNMVNQYVSTCSECNLKNTNAYVTPVQPITTYDFWERVQIDLIDMSRTSDQEFNWIGHVVDCFSKFHILFPMKTKRSHEVADNLATRVFSYFGMPYLLQSDNGCEFVNAVIKDLLHNWEGLCKTINGRPRHPQSQGAVERGNQEVEMMIRILQKTNNNNNWSSWLPQIQYSLNVRRSFATGEIPFKAVTFRNPNITENYENVNAAGSYIAEEVTSSMYVTGPTATPVGTTSNHPQILTMAPVTSSCTIQKATSPPTSTPPRAKNSSDIPSFMSMVPAKVTVERVTKETTGSILSTEVDIKNTTLVGKRKLTEIVPVAPFTTLTEGERYCNELTRSYQDITRKNETALLNSLPHLKNYLQTCVVQEHLEYGKSLIFSREDEIYNALEKYEDECDVIKIFITNKYPELNKFCNAAGDILITRTFLILSDYLEKCLGTKPRFTSVSKKLNAKCHENGDESTESDCDFDIMKECSILSTSESIDVIGESVLETRKEPNSLTPKKHGFREKMRSNLKKQQLKMKHYQKGRKRMITFERGDLVSVSVPKVDREKTECRRLKGEVVDIKDFKRGFRKYRVATAFGTLDGWLSVTQLRKYNGKVDLGLAGDHSITIREAARMNANTKGNCNCQNGCADKRCKCRKYDFLTKIITKCGTQCHNGNPCSNQEVDTYLPVLPSYGGSYNKGSSNMYFTNTCSVDCWIALFKVIQSEHPEKLEILIREYSMGKNSTMIVFLGYVRHGFFDRAKMLLARLSGIQLQHNTYDFYGNEVQNVLRHLEFLVENMHTSRCSNSDLCPEMVKTDRVSDLPCVPNVHQDTQFQTFILDWLIKIKESPCRLELLSNSSGSNVEWIPKCGVPHPYCNGVRKFAKRQFVNGFPKLLPVNVESLTDINNVPKEIAVNEIQRYKLIGITSNLREMHFVSTLFISGKEYTYDGVAKYPHLKEGRFHGELKIQNCLYLLLD